MCVLENMDDRMNHWLILSESFEKKEIVIKWLIHNSKSKSLSICLEKKTDLIEAVEILKSLKYKVDKIEEEKDIINFNTI